MAYGATKVLEGFEYAIDKGSKLLSNAAGKVGSGLKAIYDTDLVQGAVGLVKDGFSLVTSTALFQKAANLAVYVFKRVSSFCTAMVESYHYYNQCRTIARRLVTQEETAVSEHVIIKTFDGVMRPEVQIADKNQRTNDVSF